MSKKLIISFIAASILVFSFITPAFADDFLASSTAIIHEEDTSTSKPLGRLEQGDRVPILETNAAETYLKVRISSGVEGWVYKKKGKIVYETPGTPGAAAGSATSTTYNFYFGNLHSHVSELSSESNIPQSTFQDAFNYAMTTGGLDFMAITIHNHLAKPEAYQNLLSVTRDMAYYKPSKFVPIAGQEFSAISKGNHLNIFEADAWIDPEEVPNGEFKKLYETWLPKHKTQYTSMEFNHPASVTFTGYGHQEYGMDDYGDDIQKLRKATASMASTIEIIASKSHDDADNKPHVDENKTRVGAFLFALNEGWHLAPTANQDNHRKNWGASTASRTACLAKELTKEAILEAIKSSRCYATEDENMKVTFRAGNQWMGSVVDVNEITGLAIKVEDDGEPQATYTVRLYMDQIGGAKLTMNSDPIETYTLKNKEEVAYPIDTPEPDTYYFLRVTQSINPGDPNGTEDDAWTAPIWVSEIGH